MMNSLFDPFILLFVFAPSLLTLAIVAAITWSKSRGESQRDFAGRLLAAAVQQMPPFRSDWGRAMLAELDQLDGTAARWRFAVGCIRSALFPPAFIPSPAAATSARSVQGIGVNCGMLSVAIPPLALPFLFSVALAADYLFSGPGPFAGQSVPHGVIGACLVTTMLLLISGLPLGLAGWYRGDRFLWLSVLGPFLSVALAFYLWMFLYLFAGGPGGD